MYDGTRVETAHEILDQVFQLNYRSFTQELKVVKDRIDYLLTRAEPTTTNHKHTVCMVKKHYKLRQTAEASGKTGAAAAGYELTSPTNGLVKSHIISQKALLSAATPGPDDPRFMFPAFCRDTNLLNEQLICVDICDRYDPDERNSKLVCSFGPVRSNRQTIEYIYKKGYSHLYNYSNMALVSFTDAGDIHLKTKNYEATVELFSEAFDEWTESLDVIVDQPNRNEIVVVAVLATDDPAKYESFSTNETVQQFVMREDRKYRETYVTLIRLPLHRETASE